LINKEVDEIENDVRDFQLLNSGLNYANKFSQALEDADKSVKDLIESLNITGLPIRDTQLQTEKVFYLNKRELSKSSHDASSKKVFMKIQYLNLKHNQVELPRLKKKNWGKFSSLLIPLGFVLLSYIIYSVYN
jgi:hypothetical protein